MNLTETVFAPIRTTEGREWIDTGSSQLLRELAADAARKTDREIPQWADANPVVRIARCEIREVP